MTRTTDPKNLEASDQLLAKLIGIAHSKGIKLYLMAYSTTVELLINGLTERVFMKKMAIP